MHAGLTFFLSLLLNHSNKNLCVVFQVRPKLPLLRILQAAGAQGETFTLKEVMHYLGQYIMVRQLYDKRQQHMVYCGGDQLGELLGLESFSVKDPSPVYDMLKRNLTSAAMTGRFYTVWASIFNKKSHIDPCSSIESLDLARECESRDSLLSFTEHKKEEEIQSLESIKTLLNPCFLCHHRPRDGNIVHGRTAHLVACFKCAKMLKKKRSPCPVCRKDIKMVIRIFMG
uniref:MDM4 regulator of p53 n=1 Tax=Coturnix japonica TaxID=93934 RepID=A0A8C2TCM6_COTJA